MVNKASYVGLTPCPTEFGMGVELLVADRLEILQ